MSILLSGDFHANKKNELYSIKRETILEKYGQDAFGRIKYHIILGDGQFMWPGNNKKDLENYKALACRPFPVLCVIGNNEPILGMKDIPETDIGIGETVYQIHEEPFVAYLKRGKVYTIDGFKMLVLGGALSPDKKFRKVNETWWEREYWSLQEKEDLFKLLETENVFDYVLSHTGPHNINVRMFYFSVSHGSRKFDDEVAFFNNEIHQRIQFNEWYCGHWHKDAGGVDEDTKRGYEYFYQHTKILEKSEMKNVVM
jgi:3-oxoacid CoA-transferase subunit A